MKDLGMGEWADGEEAARNLTGATLLCNIVLVENNKS